MTTSTKTLYIVMGSVTGACVVALVSVLIWMYTARIDSYTLTATTTGEGQPTKPAISQSVCGAAPTVDPVTGAVTNYKNMVMPDGQTCGENVAALNALCLASRCTDPTYCTAVNASWDAYSTGGHSCINVTNPTCEQQPCDAPYCTSSSVVATLPPQHKVSINVNGRITCENVPESTVASLCNNLSEEHVYIFPDCRVAATKKTILTRSSTMTTGLIQGLLSFPAGDGKYEEMVFSYKLNTLNGSTYGTVSVRPDIGCDVSTDICLHFTIYPQPGLKPGVYSLTVYATPLWTTVPLLESTQAESLPLTASEVSSTVKPQLNPKPDVTSATNTMTIPNWFKTALSVLANKAPYNDLNIVVPTSTCGAPTTGCAVSVSDMIRITPEPSTLPLLLFAATPSFIPLENNKIMPYQFLVMVWPQIDAATLAAACPSTSTEPLYYDVTRTRTNGVGSTETLITHSIYPELLDIVRVGDSWNYTLVAYQGSNYADSKCKSQPVVVTVNVKPFDDATCHQVVPPSTVSGNPLPPWMWATPQGCQWDTSNLGAQDYYCAFEYNKDLSDLKFDPTNLYLYEQSGSTRCGLVSPSHPTLIRAWPSSFANCASDNKTCQQQACTTGYKDPDERSAVCSAQLQVGTSAAPISGGTSFVQRLSNLMNFYNNHNVHKELDTQIAPIQDATAQAELYSSYYYNCGPGTNKTEWGIDPSWCGQNDKGACAQAAEQARCDYNICEPWFLSGANGPVTYYNQKRTTFTDPAVAPSTCCPVDYTYSFNKDALPGVPRGSCELTQ